MKLNKKKVLLVIALITFSIYAYKNYLRPVSINEKIDRNSKFYINDLYQSNGLHYNKLNDKEKNLYNEMIEAYLDFDKSMKINLTAYDCKNLQSCDLGIISTWEALMMDHPELLQLSGMWYRNNNNSTEVDINLKSALLFKLQYHFGVMRIQRIVDDIKKDTKDMNEKEKVKYVYEWIGKNTKYDKVFTYMGKNQSAYSAIIKHSGVCAAYAKSSQIIFQNIGIESYIVRGESTGSHMWNIVKVDGDYYFYDSTVASSTKENDENFYKGLSQSYIRGFSLTNEELYPKTNEEEYLIN